MMYYYGDDFDKMIKAERNSKAAAEEDGFSSSFEAIFSAYHDYRNSQQWN